MHESIKGGLQFSPFGLHAMGTLKTMPINCRPSNPKRTQKICRLTQCNCHALSTEALETDPALTSTPDPVDSASSLPLVHLPVSEIGGEIFWFHFLKPLTKQTVTDQMFFGQCRGEICRGGSVANFKWVKSVRNKHENFTPKFCRKFRRCTTNLVHPCGLAENQDFATSVQSLPCPKWAFPAPCHSAPTPLTDPLTSGYLTSADLY